MFIVTMIRSFKSKNTLASEKPQKEYVVIESYTDVSKIDPIAYGYTLKVLSVVLIDQKKIDKAIPLMKDCAELYYAKNNMVEDGLVRREVNQLLNKIEEKIKKILGINKYTFFSSQCMIRMLPSLTDPTRNEEHSSMVL